MIDVKKEKDGAVTLTIQGGFDFQSYEEFQLAIGDTTAPSYTIDLRQTNTIDSAALGMLLLLRERVSEDPRRVTVQAGNGQPKEILRLANFGKLFTVL